MITVDYENMKHSYFNNHTKKDYILDVLFEDLLAYFGNIREKLILYLKMY